MERNIGNFWSINVYCLYYYLVIFELFFKYLELELWGGDNIDLRYECNLVKIEWWNIDYIKDF